MGTKSDDELGSKTARSVRSNGHSSSGGHTVQGASKSKFSRVDHIRWNNSDGLPGDNQMTTQYQEYPKHLYLDPKNPKLYVVVKDVNEENQALGNEEIIDEEEERKRLLAIAVVKKLPVDKRWGPAKLTKAIEDAGFDPTLNPFK